MKCDSNNCTVITSSNCVIYQGNPSPLLSICAGDNLTETIASIISFVTALSDGSGIFLNVDSNCTYFSAQMAGKDKSLFNIVQSLINSTCDINSRIPTSSSFTYDYKGVVSPTENSENGVVQGIINQLADVTEDVEFITDGIGNSSFSSFIDDNVGNGLLNHIQNGYGVTKTGSGSTANVSFYGAVPPKTPIWCFADLSNFEASGKGKAGTPYENWYICNGINGTPDMRGWTPAGATNLPGINGNPLYAQVDPAIVGDPSYSSNILDRKGEVKHTLNVNELPTFTVSGTTDTHSHTVPNATASVAAGESYQAYNVLTNNGNGIQTTDEAVNFTSNPIGQSIPVENRQPTIYGYYITLL